MTRLIVESEIDENGVLNLCVPVGKDEARSKVRVTIEHVINGAPAELDRRAKLRALVGAWQGEFPELDDLPPEQQEVAF